MKLRQISRVSLALSLIGACVIAITLLKLRGEGGTISPPPPPPPFYAQELKSGRTDRVKNALREHINTDDKKSFSSMCFDNYSLT